MLMCVVIRITKQTIKRLKQKNFLRFLMRITANWFRIICITCWHFIIFLDACVCRILIQFFNHTAPTTVDWKFQSMRTTNSIKVDPFFYEEDATNRIGSVYISNSTEVDKYRFQVRQSNPTPPRAVQRFDQPIIASPPPPYTPRQRRTEALRQISLNEKTSGLALLIDAANAMSNDGGADEGKTVDDAVEVATICQDEETKQNSTSTTECPDLFYNLRMLAEEATKRIAVERTS